MSLTPGGLPPPPGFQHTTGDRSVSIGRRVVERFLPPVDQPENSVTTGMPIVS
ncbi:hypothetical protein ACFO5R_06495 [Halosolutus amylolyticus]|uniref:Uncharacterized protein n=1 Tax=Halosolutus amylolyticus TaxID=2932267 RepID=A0ABD5PM22_9EURY|nr:hypothetical protein [Halosolutus amylolyticus]